jgi:D-3-phosphoglycerate dehydrogenase
MGVEQVELEELYARADIITIHVPKLKETTNLISTDTISKMKDGVYIICAARGGIVNEDDLLTALTSGKVAGAALDVFAEEPPGAIPLIDHENLICTPHLGASTEEAQTAVAVLVANQVRDYILEGIIVNAINVPSVSPEALERMRPYLQLAESLGKVQSQLGISGIRGLEIEVSGGAAEGKTSLLTAAALTGLMSGVVGDWVNMVNAPLTARERGISIKETTLGDGEDYTSLIRLKIDAEKGGINIAGAIFGSSEPRIVEIDNIAIEAIPKGNILILKNHDKPGLVGSIGVTLGKNQINIGQLQFGRDKPGGNAITVINVDSTPNEKTLKQLTELPNVVSVNKVLI